MSEPPYTVLTRKLPKYFDKIKEVREPDRVDSNWLKAAGFTSGNDTYILSIWKYIKFIDDSGVPTEFWKRYRNPAESKTVLGEAIRIGYNELFAVYEDAYRKDKEAIYAVFSTKTKKGENVINRMVSTFINLCDLADFETISVEPEILIEPTIVEKEPVVSPKKRPGIPEIHINIQLVLPETTDTSVYDRLFESLKKHLFTEEE